MTGRLGAAILGALVAGCASQPPAPPPVATPPPPPSSDVFFYPLHGQTAEQQDRDRYECYLSARQRSGFDPSVARPDRPPVRVVAVPPPGSDTVAGAATGAVIGAAVSHPWDTAEGAAIGAGAGAVIGAASDAARQQQAERIQAGQEQEQSRTDAQTDAAVLSYRSAMQACLEARGYSVR
jgi:hypothetical protein